MARWRKSFAALLIGGISASIFSVIWGILLLFTGIEPIQISFQGALISGMLTGAISEYRKLGEAKSIFISIVLGSLILLVSQ